MKSRAHEIDLSRMVDASAKLKRRGLSRDFVISTVPGVHVKVTFESAGRREKRATTNNLVQFEMWSRKDGRAVGI